MSGNLEAEIVMDIFPVCRCVSWRTYPSYIWRFSEMVGYPPNHLFLNIFMGLSYYNHPFWGSHISGKLHNLFRHGNASLKLGQLQIDPDRSR